MLQSRSTQSIYVDTISKKSTQPQASTGPAKYVAYYRLSTRAQGDSGLGLEGQRMAVANYVKGSDRRAVIVAEFIDVESGENNQRVQLAAAIDRSNDCQTQSTKP